MRKLLFAGCLLAALSTFAQTTTITTTQETKQVVEREKDGKKWTLTLKNGDVESLSLNGKTIAKQDYPKYQNVIDALTASAYGYEMPFDVTVTSKGIKEKETVATTQQATYAYQESGYLTAEQKYANMKIEEELRNDFITSAYDNNLNLELTESYMVVNGELMQKAVVDKYKNLYYRFTGEKACDACTFRVRINRNGEVFSGSRR